jgi:CubicO group peptidase (beta-lactamase class C family)
MKNNLLASLLLVFLVIFFSACGLMKFYEKNGNNEPLLKRKWLESAGILLVNKEKIIPFVENETVFCFTQNKIFPHFDSLAKLYSRIKNEWADSTNLIFLANKNTPISIPTAHKGKKIVVYFGEKADLKIFLSQNQLPDALLFLPEMSREAEEVAAQMLFGGLAISGLNDEKLLPSIPENQSFFTKKTRLAYTIPDAVNFDKKNIAKIDSLVWAAISAQAIPGAQVLIAKNGEVFFHKVYGKHTYASNANPTKLDDVYDLASVSKILTALPVLIQFQEKGLFSLDSTVKNYCPSLPKSEVSQIKMIDLLSHRAGLPASAGFWVKDLLKKKRDNKFVQTKPSKTHPVEIFDQTFVTKDYFDKRLLKGISEIKLETKGQFLYSDIGFWLLPSMVKNISGEAYLPYLSKNIYHKIGAYKLKFNPLQHFAKQNIIPTEDEPFFFGGLLHGRVHDPVAALMGGEAAHAGLFGNANDVAKLMQMYLNGGSYAGNYFFSKKTLNQFTACNFCQEGNHRGIGFDKPKLDSLKHTAVGVSAQSFGHLGFTGNYVWADPEHEILYIFLSNRVYPSQKNNKLSDLRTRLKIQQVIYDAFLKEKKQ